MPHVQIDSSGIGEKSSIAGRLVMPPMVEVEDASSLNMEQLVTESMGEPDRRMVRMIFVNQESVFSLQAEDTV